MSEYGVFPGPYSPVYGLDTEIYGKSFLYKDARLTDIKNLCKSTVEWNGVIFQVVKVSRILKLRIIKSISKNFVGFTNKH